MLINDNPWETQTQSRLVDIGTHKLNMSTSGPPRKPGMPVIILFTGGGAPAAVYTRFQRLLSSFWRVYFHDRSGYDRSERGPNKVLTAQKAAYELRTLLHRINVAPPYILIGNSYGGILARAFMEILPRGAVTGLLLAEAGTEIMYHMYPRLPPLALETIAAGVDFAELTNLRQESKLTDEEWKEAIAAIERSAAASAAEDNHGSAFELAQCQQFSRHILSPWPVSVVRCDFAKDCRTLYDAGVQKGQGSEAERSQALAFIRSVETFDDEMRASQLRLSDCHRYVQFLSHGHDDMLRRPEVYVDEVRWIMEHQ